MTKKIISYIGIALLLSGCTADEEQSALLSAEGKTPLQIAASLSNEKVVTRASGSNFDDTDELMVYIRHTVGTQKGSYTPVSADQAPKLVTFKASESPVLYWDDFSNSASSNTDLRTDGHALQTYYGYCYNGGVPSAALSEETGSLEWTIGNQTKAEDVQHADLLWSAEQKAVPYSHAKDQLGTLNVPFSHAMSEVTVTLKTDDTFSGNPQSATVLTLKDINTIAQVNAPEGVVSSGTPADIRMFAAAYVSGNTRNYTAVITPGTSFTLGNELLKITDVDGNDYSLKVTADMLKTTAWAEGYTDDQSSIVAKSGVNYHLDITVSKTAVTVQASLTDWVTVNANGEGDIIFNNDIKVFTVEGNGIDFEDGASFRLYWKESAATANYSLATTSTYDATEKVWSNTPAIYWPNGTDKFFFRALANNTGTDVNQGEDVLWGTTAKHASLEAGVAIAPRTGNVPMAFEHAMSKIKFVLETATGDAAVDLTNATVSVSNLYTSGTISIEDGSITTAIAKEPLAISSLSENTDVVVVPQTIDNNAIVTITLNDGTTYRLQLNLCKDSDNAVINEWKRGEHYTYTIHIEKEQVSFRAMILDWEENTGSGEANLEWD